MQSEAAYGIIYWYIATRRKRRSGPVQRDGLREGAAMEKMKKHFLRRVALVMAY